MITRFFPSIALAAFAFGIVHSGQAAAEPVTFTDGPLLLQLMAPHRLGVARPAPQPAAYSPATVAPRARQPAYDPRYGRPIDPAFLPREVAYPDRARPRAPSSSTPKRATSTWSSATAWPSATASASAVRASNGRAFTMSRARPSGRDGPRRRRCASACRMLPVHMEGGIDNPLGARALYLGSTLYRIHGSNQPWTIGHAVSSGCIRMRNQDVVDLYDRVKVGTKVIVQ